MSEIEVETRYAVYFHFSDRTLDFSNVTGDDVEAWKKEVARGNTFIVQYGPKRTYVIRSSQLDYMSTHEYNP